MEERREREREREREDEKEGESLADMVREIGTDGERERAKCTKLCIKQVYCLPLRQSLANHIMMTMCSLPLATLAWPHCYIVAVVSISPIGWKDLHGPP